MKWSIPRNVERAELKSLLIRFERPHHCWCSCRSYTLRLCVDLVAVVAFSGIVVDHIFLIDKKRSSTNSIIPSELYFIWLLLAVIPFECLSDYSQLLLLLLLQSTRSLDHAHYSPTYIQTWSSLSAIYTSICSFALAGKPVRLISIITNWRIYWHFTSFQAETIIADCSHNIWPVGMRIRRNIYCPHLISPNPLPAAVYKFYN